MIMTPDLIALGFQALLTLTLSFVHVGLWRQGWGRFHATWAAAWLLYALRLVFISAFLVQRHEGWLFAHQVTTALTALALLWATLQLAQDARWRRRYLWFGVAAVAWSAFSVFQLHNMAVAGISGAVLLSVVTLWTAIVFFRRHRRRPSGGALTLAFTFAIWSLHHLDYPILRGQGNAVLYGVFADVLLIVAAAVGALALALGEGRRSLEERTVRLEQLTRLLLRAQEDERRRIARELHDSVGQALTTVKIELDLEGRREASALVAGALQQVRNVSDLLRPPALDDLGLEAALESMVREMQARSGLSVTLELAPGALESAEPVQVVVYRIVQEALTNVVRHAQAGSAQVRLVAARGGIALEITDDGQGTGADPVPHLGLLGMRERVTDLGGRLEVTSEPGKGFRIEAWLPATARP
ncbi:MAG: sensor histidine kinase [Candidatus Eisenbacteria bacterium]|uniref:histidine kinase n=1 Tax=Eiseniibacteriota bacterium TaxID=2212470 RepID=A0A849T007_UNCEI|nr:sensor histidine kinase [Candidatus Eisenbacteria bacterium]